MAKTRQRKCLCCKDLVDPDRRNINRQRYCSNADFRLPAKSPAKSPARRHGWPKAKTLTTFVCRCTSSACWRDVTRLDVAAHHKGAHDAFAHIGLNMAKDRVIESSGRKNDHTLRCRLRVGMCSRIDGLRWPSKSLKHPINHTEVKMQMRGQAGTTTKLQRRLTCTQVMSALTFMRSTLHPAS